MSKRFRPAHTRRTAPPPPQRTRPPFLLIGLSAFTLTMLLAGLAMLADSAAPSWLWALNAVALTFAACSLAYGWREACFPPGL